MRKTMSFLLAACMLGVSVQAWAAAPELVKKERLAAQLLSGAASITGKESIPLTPFDPKGDYSLEVKATVTSTANCGLSIEAKAAGGKGFRVLLDAADLKWAAPLASPEQLTAATGEVTLRFVVQGAEVHIYKGADYVTSKAIVDVEPLDENGAAFVFTSVPVGCWDGCDVTGTGSTQKSFGWDNSNTSYSGWADVNGGGGMRIMTDVNTLNYNGVAYDNVDGHDDRYMYIRWDASDIQGTVWSFPISEKLEPDATYEFALLCAFNSNTKQNMIIGVGGSRSATDATKTGQIADALATKEITLGNSKALQRESVTFTTDTAGQYYILITSPTGNANGPLHIITALTLTKIPAGYDVETGNNPGLTLAKYCDGAADISVSAVDYDDWAYAPGAEVIQETLTPKATLDNLLTEYDLALAGGPGSKAVQTFAPSLAGEYTVEVAATVAPVTTGRGMDIEVRGNPVGAGFRTALGSGNLAAASPYSLPLENIAAAAAGSEQVVRYAVKGDNVHVFLNSNFVRTFATRELGEMNADGTAETSVPPSVTYPVADNLITNPEFAETNNGGAPAGWTTDGTMGGGSNARVQTQTYPGGQLDHYGVADKKAFVIRYDGDGYDHYFSYGVTLEANTWYEYSFDAVGWGANSGRTFNVVVATAADGASGVIATRSVTAPTTAAAVRREAVRFQTTAADTYYLIFAEKDNNNAGAIGITDLCLTKNYSIAGVLVGKNYTADTASLRVRYVAVDATGAYAPVAGTVVKTNQIIAFDSIPVQYQSAQTYRLTEATASSGLPVTYAGSDDAVATVTPEGLVTFVGAGTLTITASQAGSDRYSAAQDSARTLTVSSNVPQTITFDSIAVQDFTAGTLQLSATATSGLPVTFSSDNDAVATVSVDGLVTFASADTVNITAAQAGGTVNDENGTVDYDVAPPVTRQLIIVSPLTAIAFDESNVDLRQGTSLQLTPTLTPANPTVAQLEWTSSDPDVVSVSSEGLLTARIAGEAVITVSATDSGIVANHSAATATLNVRVTPSLVKKELLSTVLLGTEASITEKTEIPVTPFNPKGDYSVEVKATVTSSANCGLNIEARTATGKGFRVSLSESELKWAAPLASPEKLADATAAEDVALRFVVQGEQVHIYKGEDYIATKDAADIGDVENGEEVFPEPEPTPVNVGCWDGCDGPGTQKDYGWDNSNASYSGWNAVDAGGGMRIMTDVQTLKYNDVAYDQVEGHDDRYMYIRWDAGDLIGTVWSFPIAEQLEAGTTYKLSLLCAYNSNSFANMFIGVGGSRSVTDDTRTGQIADARATKEVALTNTSKALQLDSLTFTTDTAGQYYILITAPQGGNNGPLCIITAPAVQKMFSISPKLTLAKHCDGAASISVKEVSYEDRAWAPGKEQLTEALPAKAYLSDTLVGTPAQRDLILVGDDGSKATQKLWFPASGDYTVEVAATIAETSEGRGMDVEMHDAAGYGFRTSLNTDELAYAAPFSAKDWMADAATGEQLLRYAVKGDNVHVFFNNNFVRTFSRQALGSMNPDGTAETALGTSNPLNLIANPDFAETEVDAWPEGWISDVPLDISPLPRVQVGSAELGAYPEGTKALMLRFDRDQLVPKSYSCPVALKPETAYEYSFDLLAWGSARVNQSYFLVVSDKRDGTVSYTESIDEVEGTTTITYSVSEVGNNGVIALDTITTTAASGSRGARQTLRFTTPASANAVDTFYLSFAKMEHSGDKIFAITYQNLAEVGQSPVGVLVGKNYAAGAADVQVRYITVDASGAFAPVEGTAPVVTGQDILFDSIPAQYFVNETYRLTEAIATSRLQLEYAGSDNSVATVTPEGLVTFVAVGELTITASVTGASPLYSSVAPVARRLVISSMLPQTIAFEEIPEQFLSTGTLQLAATATSGLPVVFAGDNDAVATVTSTGLVTFAGLGTVNITATQDGGEAGGDVYAAAAPVARALVIKPVPVTEVALSVASRDMLVCDTLLLVATVNPDDATNKSIAWASNSSSVASVRAVSDTSAMVIALAVGTANITVTTADGGKTAICQLLVRSGSQEPPTGIDDLGSNSVSAYIAGGELFVISPEAERVEVYSMTSVKLLSRSKQAGLDRISIAHLPLQVLIVKGSSGWVKKVLSK
ncbi:MAG: Ig-like domain-containing protein [Prevotellaceae bacterium]|jgi:uncharacterized protein YjdB|nr:Ig-like domain-containing protein [Prevotellaceae bacterium]